MSPIAACPPAPRQSERGSGRVCVDRDLRRRLPAALPIHRHLDRAAAAHDHLDAALVRVGCAAAGLDRRRRRVPAGAASEMIDLRQATTRSQKRPPAAEAQGRGRLAAAYLGLRAAHDELLRRREADRHRRLGTHRLGRDGLGRAVGGQEALVAECDGDLGRAAAERLGRGGADLDDLLERNPVRKNVSKRRLRSIARKDASKRSDRQHRQQRQREGGVPLALLLQQLGRRVLQAPCQHNIAAVLGGMQPRWRECNPDGSDIVAAYAPPPRRASAGCRPRQQQRPWRALSALPPPPGGTAGRAPRPRAAAASAPRRRSPHSSGHPLRTHATPSQHRIQIRSGATTQSHSRGGGGKLTSPSSSGSEACE